MPPNPTPTVHEVMLPERTGYHVLLAVLEVADTGNAFYQVIDLDFVGNDVAPVLGTLSELRATSVSTSAISLAWNAPSTPTSSYRVHRNNVLIATASSLAFSDEGFNIGTLYNYAVSSVNDAGQESALSQSIYVTTLASDPADMLPTAPQNLHSMGVTTNSVSMMWEPSSKANMLQGYLVYREGDEIARISANQLRYDNEGLVLATSLRYFVTAIDDKNRLSIPNNVLKITILEKKDDDGDDNSPEPDLNQGRLTPLIMPVRKSCITVGSGSVCRLTLPGLPHGHRVLPTALRCGEKPSDVF